MAKDVESMNRFELMNEVERLRKSDVSAKLGTEIGWLRQELRIVRERLLGAERALDNMAKNGENNRVESRRKQPQGRRKANDRRVVKSKDL